MFIPKELYNNRILSKIIEHIEDSKKIIDFDCLSEDDQDDLVYLGIAALGEDVDIVLNKQSLVHLMLFISTADRDEEIELVNQVKWSARSSFSDYYNQMFSEQYDTLKLGKYIANGGITTVDQQTGETLYL